MRANRDRFSRKRRFLKIVALICLAIATISVRYYFILRSEGLNDHLKYEVGEKLILEGIIVDEPDRRENSTRLVFGVQKVKILLTTERYSSWEYGDRVSVEGKLERPENFEGGNGREFDYVGYLGKDGIRYQIIFPKITLLGSGHSSFIRRNLFKTKNVLVQSIDAVIPEPESALLAGILLGSKHSLGKDLLEDFRRAGIIHIVVLSGYNVTIIAEFVMRCLGFLPRLFGFWVGGFGIILFALMTGAGASTVRASIMALLGLVAQASGRTYTASRALFLAAFVMILHNPRILLSDPGFQLSFMATFGLIYASPVVKSLPFMQKIPEKFHLRELIVSNVTTQIFLLPMLLYQTGMFSFVSLPVNFLTLVFIPFTMLVGFLAGMVGLVSTFLALPFAFLSHILLSYVIFISRFFSHLPLAVFELRVFPFWVVIAAYAVYFYILWTRRELNPQVSIGKSETLNR